MTEKAYLRIADDVIPYFGKVINISYDVFVIAAPPDGLVEGRVFPFLDRADIFVGGHGFKPFNNRRNRGHIGGIVDLKNEMDVVWHDDVGVKLY